MSRRRTWTQRLLLALNCVVIVACFGVAAGLLISRHYGQGIVRVDLPSIDQQADAGAGVQPEAVPEVSAGDDAQAPTPSGPVETFPSIDPEALNFLITGADNHSCVDPDSPFAGAFGDRESMGDRSDTIMLLRIDPASKKAAVLSFPRDLWVDIPGRSPNRINTAYERNNPTRLIGAINENFGLTVDHFVQVDFCAFKHLVDTVGGVAVPFEYPAKDPNTGLNVPQAGCFTFTGDHALAYVRSRHYFYLNEAGKWIEDPASDLGRISRQQDFLGRVLSSALAKGLNPGVARGIIQAVQKDVVVDTNLTPGRMLEIAGIVSDFEPGDMATYQVTAKGAKIGENAVLLPQIKGETMQAILAIFRGDAPLADAPQQEIDTTTSTPDTTSASVPSASTIPTQTTVAPTETSAPTTPVTAPEQKVPGIVPPDDEC